MAISYSPAVNSARIITALGFTPASAGAVVIADGSAAAPGMIYGSDVDTGFYQATPGDGTLSIALGGANMGTFSSTGLALAAGINPTVTLGTAANTNITPNDVQVTLSGNAGGATDLRALRQTVTLSGANSVVQILNRYTQNEIRHTAGTLATTVADEAYVRLGLNNSAASNITTAVGFRAHIANESLAGVITTGVALAAGAVDLATGSGTIGSMYGLTIGNQGHASRVTTAAVGISISDFTGGATLTAALQIAMTSGTGKRAIYHTGTAISAHVGDFAFGHNNTTLAVVDIRKTSAGATTIPLYLNNSSGAANTAVAISLDPTTNGPNTRDGMIRATSNGAGVITMDIMCANGGAPTVIASFAPSTSTLTGTWGVSGVITALRNTAVSAGANTQAFIKASTTSNLGAYYGTGDPTFSAAKGSTYVKTDATTTTTRLWINTDGSTTWAFFTASA